MEAKLTEFERESVGVWRGTPVKTWDEGKHPRDNRGRFGQGRNSSKVNRPKGSGKNDAIVLRGAASSVFSIVSGKNINTSIFDDDVFTHEEGEGDKADGIVKFIFDQKKKRLIIPNENAYGGSSHSYLASNFVSDASALTFMRGTIDLNKKEIIWHDVSSQADAISRKLERPEQWVKDRLERNLTESMKNNWTIDKMKAKHSYIDINKTRWA